MKVIWGYGLFPEERGNHVNKKMEDCTGEEILAELCHHLGSRPSRGAPRDGHLYPLYDAVHHESVHAADAR